MRNRRYVGMRAIDIAEYSERVYGVRVPPNRYVYVPCGRCIDCTKRRMHGYKMRLLYEVQKYPRSIFITLTFDEKSLKRFSDDPNKSIRLFLDRCRKAIGYAPRHWIIAEFGKKRGRLHYHGILFDCLLTNEQLTKLWKYGNTWIGYANDITARYIVKYITKNTTKGIRPPRVITSHGIGDSFLYSEECKLLKSQLRTYFTVNGYRVPLPRYYLDKMYNRREQEIISYYLHMESVQDWYYKGKTYATEKLMRDAMANVAQDYKRLGLISPELPRKRRLTAEMRLLFHFETYNQMNPFILDALTPSEEVYLPF